MRKLRGSKQHEQRLLLMLISYKMHLESMLLVHTRSSK